MSNLLSEIEATEILQPHLATLKRVMDESLEDLNKALSVLSENANNRAKSSLLHSIAVEKAKKYFDKIQDVRIKSKYQSIQIIFSNKLIGRIKKVNKDNLSTNAKSSRNDAIVGQQISLFSELMPDLVQTATFIDLGYRLDETGSDFDRLRIICRYNDAIEWNICFKETEKEITILSNEQTDPLTTKEETQIKIKQAK